MVLQADGKIVLAGSAANVNFPVNADFAAARLNSDGSLDSGFGSGGMVVTDMGDVSDGASGVVMQGNNIILVGVKANSGMGTSQMALARYTSSGNLDPMFSFWGTSVIYLPTDATSVNGVVYQASDRKIMVTGLTGSNGGGGAFVARITPSGALDLSF